MTAALSLRLRDEGKRAMAGVFLLYPEPMLPFGTSAATENNRGPYLNCESSLAVGVDGTFSVHGHAR
jgi:hypothetical protein